MKSNVITYNIKSKKLEKKERVILIADLHDFYSKKKRALQLIKDINELNANHVSIAGDIMQGVKYSSLENCRKLSYFLDGIAENQPVFLSLGNHDLVGLTTDGRKNFSNLGNNKVFPLDNESVIYNNFRITGFTPSRKTYAFYDHYNNNNNKMFANDYNSSNLTVEKDSKYFEEFIGHAPHPLVSEYVRQNANGINYYDMYLTGHLHDGYIPNFYKNKNLQKLQDYGFWEMPFKKDKDGKIISLNPFIYSKINLCRGVHFISNNGVVSKLFEDGSTIEVSNEHGDYIIPLIITGGVSRFFGLSTNPQITIIDIEPESDKIKLLKNTYNLK